MRWLRRSIRFTTVANSVTGDSIIMFSFIFGVVIIQVLIIKIIIISHEVSVVIHPAERAMEAEGASATTT